MLFFFGYWAISLPVVFGTVMWILAAVCLLGAAVVFFFAQYWRD